MAKLECVCVVDRLTYDGRTYCFGDIYRGPNLPADAGWFQREEQPPSREVNLSVTGASRGSVSWGKRDLPAPQQLPQASHSGVPQPSPEEHWRRELDYLRRFAREDYADYVSRHPREALQPGPDESRKQTG